MYHNIRLFFNYIIIGGVATAVDIIFLYFLVDFYNLWYFYATAISYLLGMITNYTMNKYWNFKDSNKKIFAQFGVFTCVALVGLGLNQIIIYFLVECANLWYILAKLIAVVFIVFWSFYGHKNLTFKIYG